MKKFVIFALLLSGCAAGPMASNIPTTPVTAIVPANPTTLSGQQQAAMQAKIRERMKDPNSAQFGPVVANKIGSTVFACGTVNAKNSYGGYTGFTPFIASFPSGGTGVIVSVAADDADSNISTRTMCTKQGAGLPPA